MVLSGDGNVRVSARNQFSGKVTSASQGAINSEVGIRLPSGATMYALITNEAKSSRVVETTQDRWLTFTAIASLAADAAWAPVPCTSEPENRVV